MRCGEIAGLLTEDGNPVGVRNVNTGGTKLLLLAEQKANGDLRMYANDEAVGAWEDLRFPVQGINPAGSAAPPTVDATTRPGTLLFASNADNHVAGVAQMPHAWKAGTEIHPHVHWCKTTSAAGGVVWQWRYSIAWIGETFPAYSAWTSATNAVSPADTADRHALDSFPAVDMTGKKESCVILWEIRRYTDDAADNYAAAARLLEFDIHFQVEKSGTYSEIPS